MNIHYKKSVEIFLAEFGLGRSVPGSGCGCAFHASLDSKMILTHIELSIKQPYTNKNNSQIPKYNNLKKEVNKIFEELSKLYETDYKIFEEYRKVFKKINDERIVSKRCLLENHRDNLLTKSTKVLLDIANLSLRLTAIAIEVFRNGYPEAKGESGLPMKTLPGVVEGCLLIVNENISNLSNNNDVERILSYETKLNKKLSDLKRDIEKKFDKAKRISQLKLKINTLILNTQSKANNKLHGSTAAKELKDILWSGHLSSIETGGNVKSPLEIYDPKLILQLIGYNVNYKESLGQYSDSYGFFEVAGFLDCKEKQVAISNKFKPASQRFTMAHELGHLIFQHHGVNQNQIHRDRPITKGAFLAKKDWKEKQANQFASDLLMPEEIVIYEFENRFGLSRFVINEDVIFGLKVKNTTEFRKKYKNINDVSNFLASLEYYNRNEFLSISKYFGVSTKTMAIRLLELDLIEY
jgi:Zn-dependent peptidase ImmA (M78 family)/formiminotetrahydrofolate cyclodeaminase